jgi:DNA-binding LacI/PurR family transcriptional regulator
MSHATIKDIARRLNISLSTVSRALRNHPDVNEKTKGKVLSIAREINYFPNSLAKGLKNQKTNTIGVIVPEIEHHFFSAVISGIESVAYNADFTILVCQSNESYEREVINTHALASNRVAGLLVSISQATKDVEHFKILQKRDIPIVFFDRVSNDIQASKVIVDDYDGAYNAVNYLIEKGYKNIAYISGPEYISISRLREKGYRDALLKNNLPINDDLIVHGGFSEKDGIKAVYTLLQQKIRPDAIFAVNDPVAIGAFIGLREKNIRIPEDIALVGYSNNPVSSLIDPQITTVDQPAYEIGKTAAELVLEQINNGDSDFNPQTKTLKTKLIIRNST